MRKAAALLPFTISLSTGVAFSQQEQGTQYHVFRMNFAEEVPASVFVTGGECVDRQCSRYRESLRLYDGAEAFKCEKKYGGNVSRFGACLAGIRLDSKVHPIEQQGDLVAIGVDVAESSFGHILWFAAEGNGYVPWYSYSLYDCSAGETCFFPEREEDATGIGLDKRQRVGAAEVHGVAVSQSQLTATQKRIRVGVPVRVEPTVCSPWSYASEYPSPRFPTGYGDLSAEVDVRLMIYRAEDGQGLFQDEVQLSLEADECVQVPSFAWTASEDLRCARVRIVVETDVIDGWVRFPRRESHEVSVRLSAHAPLDGGAGRAEDLHCAE